MKVLRAEPPAAREARPATRILHDEPNARVVRFHLLAGQQVHPHRSASTVLLQVVSGSGTFTGEADQAVLGPGDTALYAPGELHGISAGADPLYFIAVITPRPA